MEQIGLQKRPNPPPFLSPTVNALSRMETSHLGPTYIDPKVLHNTGGKFPPRANYLDKFSGIVDNVGGSVNIVGVSCHYGTKSVEFAILIAHGDPKVVCVRKGIDSWYPAQQRDSRADYGE